MHLPRQRTDPAALLAGHHGADAATPEEIVQRVTGLRGMPVRLDSADRSPDPPPPAAGSEAELITDLRAEWRAHRDSPATGRCPLCGVPSCLRWRYADSLLRMCGDDPEGDAPVRLTFIRKTALSGDTNCPASPSWQ